MATPKKSRKDSVFLGKKIRFMSNAFPDGYFRKNIILFGHELNADTFVSRGFEVGFSDPPLLFGAEKTISMMSFRAFWV